MDVTFGCSLCIEVVPIQLPTLIACNVAAVWAFCSEEVGLESIVQGFCSMEVSGCSSSVPTGCIELACSTSELTDCIGLGALSLIRNEGFNVNVSCLIVVVEGLSEFSWLEVRVSFSWSQRGNCYSQQGIIVYGPRESLAMMTWAKALLTLVGEVGFSFGGFSSCS